MKSKISIFIMVILLTAGVANSYAATPAEKRALKERVANMTEEEKISRAEEIRLRTEEIKAMDRSTLSRSERKQLKKELREMDKEARLISGGVYLSVAAIIIIILVLILIL